MSWTYKTKKIGDVTQFPENTFGFIYLVTHKPTNKSYIGKKVLYHTRKQKIGKRELQRLEKAVGRRPSYKLVVKESDWLNYYGSQKEIKNLLLEGKKDEFERIILKLSPSKKLLTYYEVKFQMIYQVLEKPDEFFNDNILGKFFTKDFEDVEFEDFLESEE
jgi:hypothetical protein|tara:strand:- start:783 stop:1265 length:483 start_codon:yes stop_codon:yes gene_type:complete